MAQQLLPQLFKLSTGNIISLWNVTDFEPMGEKCGLRFSDQRSLIVTGRDALSLTEIFQNFSIRAMTVEEEAAAKGIAGVEKKGILLPNRGSDEVVD